VLQTAEVCSYHFVQHPLDQSAHVKVTQMFPIICKFYVLNTTMSCVSEKCWK